MPDGIIYHNPWNVNYVLQTQEQCNRELDYCWCVDQVDGRPIDGSVVRGSYPKQVKCDAAPEKTSEGESVVVFVAVLILLRRIDLFVWTCNFQYTYNGFKMF